MDLMIIVQARMTSTRLPGKVLRHVGAKTLLQVMLERLQDLKQYLVIATTDDGTEAPIVEFCHASKIRYFRGSVENVLDRYYQAAKAFGATADTAIVRLTSDCPLVDPVLVQRTIDEFMTGRHDIVTLGAHTGYPRGLDSTVFSFKMLESTNRLAEKEADREHVTHGMARLHPRTKVCPVMAPVDKSHYRITVDKADDLKAVSAIVETFDGRLDFTYQELIDLLDSRPDIVAINAHVRQKFV